MCMHPMQVAAGAGCGLQMGCMSATGARCCPPAQSSHLNGLNPSLWHRGGDRVCMHPTQVAASAGWGLQTGCMPGSATAQPGTSRHIPTSPGCPNQQYLAKWCVCCWQGWEQCALYCTHLGEPIHAQNTLFCHPLIFTSHTSQDVLLRSGPPCDGTRLWRGFRLSTPYRFVEIDIYRSYLTI